MPRGWASRRISVLVRDNYMCYLCGLPGANSVDHVIPHAQGGSDGMENLKAAHMACNEKKRDYIATTLPRVSRFG